MSRALRVLSHQLAVAELTADEERPDPRPQPFCTRGWTLPPVHNWCHPIRVSTFPSQRKALPCHWPGDAHHSSAQKVMKRGGKSHCRAELGITALCPGSSNGEQSRSRRAESLTNCPVIHLPVGLTRGITMSLCCICFLYWEILTLQVYAMTVHVPRDIGMQLSPWHLGQDPSGLGPPEKEKGLRMGTEKWE